MKLKISILNNPRKQLPIIVRYLSIAILLLLLVINVWFVYTKVFAYEADVKTTSEQSGINESLFNNIVESANAKQSIDLITVPDVNDIFTE